MTSQRSLKKTPRDCLLTRALALTSASSPSRKASASRESRRVHIFRKRSLIDLLEGVPGNASTLSKGSTDTVTVALPALLHSTFFTVPVFRAPPWKKEKKPWFLMAT